MIENCFTEFKSLLTNPGLFIDRRIGILTHNNRVFEKDYLANDLYRSYTEYMLDLDRLHNMHYGFKITGLETFNGAIKQRCQWLSDIWKKDNITAHGYLGYSEGASFDTHVDDCNVYLYVISGNKQVIIKGESYELINGHGIFIPVGTPHKVINLTDNVAISFGHI